MSYLNEIISVRISKELKRKLDLFRDKVKWSKEIRAFLEKRVEELLREKAVESANKIIKKLPQIPKGTAVEYVREDRDSY